MSAAPSSGMMGTEGYVYPDSNPAGALCGELPCLFCGTTQTAMPPLIFFLVLGYIGCPDVRVRHRLPR